MQRTADVHHHVANPSFPPPNGVFEHTAAFDAAVDMFDAHAPPRDLPIARFLGSCPRFPMWLLRRLNDLHAVQRPRLNAQILPQLAPRRQRIRRRVGEALVMHTAGMRSLRTSIRRAALISRMFLRLCRFFLPR